MSRVLKTYEIVLELFWERFVKTSQRTLQSVVLIKAIPFLQLVCSWAKRWVQRKENILETCSLRDVGNHYVPAVKHVITISSFVKTLVKSFHCLQPEKLKSKDCFW